MKVKAKIDRESAQIIALLSEVIGVDDIEFALNSIDALVAEVADLRERLQKIHDSTRPQILPIISKNLDEHIGWIHSVSEVKKEG